MLCLCCGQDGENATALDVARRKKAVAAERQSQQALATASEIERLLLQARELYAPDRA